MGKAAKQRIVYIVTMFVVHVSVEKVTTTNQELITLCECTITNLDGYI